MSDIKKEVNKKIQEMIEDDSVTTDEVIRYVKGKCQTIALTPLTLGMLFEMYAEINGKEDDLTSYFSREIPISELKNIHPGFESTNGCQWARSDNSYLGKKYKIKRPKKGGRVFAIQLDGPNRNSVKKYRDIRPDIRDSILKERCAILDISDVEVDYKNGKYNDLSNLSVSD